MTKSRAEKAVTFTREMIVLGGFGLTSYGAWLIFEPAGYICGGVQLAAVGLIGIYRAG